MGTKHTVEIRQEAVRVALTGGLTCKQVASDFRVGFSTLGRWVQQERKTLPEPSVQSGLEKEVAMLRKENRLLREEREVLKKATIFFAGQKP
jgi:transposase